MEETKMLGAIVGDIVGSPYEFYNTKSPSFELFTPQSSFTDDSVMTLAVAKWLIEDEAHTIHYLIYCMQELGNRYPNDTQGLAPVSHNTPNCSNVVGILFPQMFPHFPKSVIKELGEVL